MTFFKDDETNENGPQIARNLRRTYAPKPEMDARFSALLNRLKEREEARSA